MKTPLFILGIVTLGVFGVWQWNADQGASQPVKTPTKTIFTGQQSPLPKLLNRSVHVDFSVQQCQHPVGYQEQVSGTDCTEGCDTQTWDTANFRPWQTYSQGEYVGHDRTAHVPVYRLRPDDQIECVFRVTREETAHPYRLNVGDEISIRSFTDEKLNTTAVVQPDGTISVALLPPVRAARRTTEQLRETLDEMYSKFYKLPTITVALLRGNTKLEDLRAAVDSRYGAGGQTRLAKVTPEGTIQLPAIGSIPAQGLTLDELAREINARYRAEIEGIEVTPVLSQRAPRYVYVLGEVKTPGRYQLEGPTTVMQSVAMAGGWNVGARLKQVVVFRRGDDWRLMATKLDLQSTLWGNKPCPADEIWVNDSDVILVPKSNLLLADDFINLVFTRGIYAVMPFSTSYAFNDFTRL